MLNQFPNIEDYVIMFRRFQCVHQEAGRRVVELGIQIVDNVYNNNLTSKYDEEQYCELQKYAVSFSTHTENAQCLRQFLLQTIKILKAIATFVMSLTVISIHLFLKHAPQQPKNEMKTTMPPNAIGPQNRKLRLPFPTIIYINSKENEFRTSFILLQRNTQRRFNVRHTDYVTTKYQ